MPQVYTSFLVLANGTVCQGWSFISSPVSSGEAVFNTGMTGYQEIITDPSYYDQIVMFTYPEIGNTGINSLDMESNSSHVKGLVVKSICIHPSNWLTAMSLPSYLVKYQIPHIFGVDTRYLTKQLRSQGVMLASIACNHYDSLFVKSEIVKLKLSQETHVVDKVTTCKSYGWPNRVYGDIRYIACNTSPHRTTNLKVVVVDYGVKFSILERLKSYGCDLVVVPAHTSYVSIVMQNPDGVLLSNGPGDPSLIGYAIENIQKIVSLNIPVFGICLGHQLLSLATGANTVKLKFGHRGLNHPAGASSMVKMTSQNHGYVVSMDNLSQFSCSVFCLNFNDQTVAGLVYKYKPCFSVQYHPEASPGPNDSDYLFAHFVALMSSCQVAKSH